jgi:hypothetical protein
MNLNKRLAKARSALTNSERRQDRQRAAKALGRPLRLPELVHHHSRRQLVICPNASYHRMLHTLEDCRGNFVAFYKQYLIFHSLTEPVSELFLGYLAKLGEPLPLSVRDRLKHLARGCTQSEIPIK